MAFSVWIVSWQDTGHNTKENLQDLPENASKNMRKTCSKGECLLLW